MNGASHRWGEYGLSECHVTFLEVLQSPNKFCKYLERALM